MKLNLSPLVKKLVFTAVFLGLLGTLTELHTGDCEEETNAPAQHCCVNCCPTRHLGPAEIEPKLLLPDFASREMVYFFELDHSKILPKSIFHPPKSILS